MLIYQAVFALEYFADVRIDAKEMEQHVIEAAAWAERHKNGPRGKEPPFRGDRSLWGVGPSSQLREHRQNKTRKS